MSPSQNLEDTSPRPAEADSSSDDLSPSPPPPIKDQVHLQLLIEWVKQNYEAAEGSSLQRSVFYDHYVNFCTDRGLQKVTAAALGKVVRMVFPNIKARRLGMRGHSKYHYHGVRAKGDAQLSAATESHELYPTPTTLSANRGKGKGPIHVPGRTSTPVALLPSWQPYAEPDVPAFYSSESEAPSLPYPPLGRSIKEEWSSEGSPKTVPSLSTATSSTSSLSSSPVNSTQVSSSTSPSPASASTVSSSSASSVAATPQPFHSAPAAANYPTAVPTSGFHTIVSPDGSSYPLTQGTEASTSATFPIDSFEPAPLPPFPPLELGGVHPNIVRIEPIEALFRSHCQNVYDIICQGLFDKVEEVCLNFWFHMPPRFREIFTIPIAAEYVRRCHVILYSCALRSLVPNVLKALPVETIAALRQFAASMPTLIQHLSHYIPQPLPGYLATVFVSFGDGLKKATTLNHIACAAASVMQTRPALEQMSSDWENIDFEVINERMSSLCECDWRLTVQFEELFRENLELHLPLDRWVAYLNQILEAFLRVNSRPFPVGPLQEFIKGFAAYYSAVTRDLTLRNAQSFGSFHLLKVFLDEYLDFILADSHARYKAMQLQTMIVNGHSFFHVHPFMHRLMDPILGAQQPQQQRKRPL